MPFAWRPASSTALLTWALGTSGSKSIGVRRRCPESSAAAGRRRGDARAHALERHDDAAHRAPAQRVVAGHRRCETGGRRGCRRASASCCRNCRHRARRRARAGRRALGHLCEGSIPRMFGRLSSIATPSARRHRASSAVGAGGIAVNRGCAVGQSRKQGVPMGDRLVARRPDTSRVLAMRAVP